MPVSIRPAPRLASDVARTWLTSGVSFGFTGVVAGVVALGAPTTPLLAGLNPTELVNAYVYITWTLFSVVMTATTLWTFGRASAPELRVWLERSAVPERFWPKVWWAASGGGAVSWSLIGSTIALGALLELATSGRDITPLTLIPAVAVVPSSIVVMIVSFAVAHARLDRDRGFDFPGDAAPRFIDYLYLSVQITTTFGGSDVALTSSRVRRAVSFHSLIAFGYNAFVIALLVSAILAAVDR